MAQAALCQKLAPLDQGLDHRAIGVAVLAFGGQDALAGKMRDLGPQTAVRLDQGEGLGIFGGVAGERCRHQLEIVFAMAGRGIDETCAGIGGDMRARKQGHLEFIAQAAQGMRGNRGAKLALLHCAHARDHHLGLLGDILREKIGQQICSPALANDPSAASAI